MTSPHQELMTRLDDLEADVDFVASAAKLRPRLGDAIQWDGAPQVVDLARMFMKAKKSQPEMLYGAMLVRLLATLERYVRQLIAHVVTHKTRAVKSYDDISEKLALRNLVLTGRALGALDAPKDHMSLDAALLVSNLASCSAGRTDFCLNASAFSAVVTGSSPTVFEKAFKNVEIKNWWDAIGRSGALLALLGTKGPRATSEQAKARLRQLWRWRNHIAHGGDEDTALSEATIRDAIQFVREFARALEAEIYVQLK